MAITYKDGGYEYEVIDTCARYDRIQKRIQSKIADLKERGFVEIKVGDFMPFTANGCVNYSVTIRGKRKLCSI